MIALLFASGWLGAMGVTYFLVSVGGATMSLSLMIIRVDFGRYQKLLVVV